MIFLQAEMEPNHIITCAHLCGNLGEELVWCFTFGDKHMFSDYKATTFHNSLSISIDEISHFVDF